MKRTFLALTALLAGFAVSGASAAPITLTGTIRDFNAWGTTFGGVAGHIDFENPCCAVETGIVNSTLGVDNKPTLNTSISHTQVNNSAATFDQWYHDTPGVNMSASISLTLNPITATLYQYSSNAFFPIDGQLLGQSMSGHNFGFTTEFHTQFTYVAANNDTFDFVGDDDVWVFINKNLAIDLGGVHGPASGSVNLNASAAALGLIDGNTYTLDIFQAERHTVGSDFTITTSLALQSVSVPEPGSLALLGLAAGLMGLVRRRRQH